ncbi:hypothetical protein [Pseudomonas saxonica]|uniref:Uncharacterized protein n=1 Tax=Pseudomonas saxonica TaxID=2600598 RepID=A0A5C5PS15_9PSED|nr:hypothetical protein [Pseudomonas saxonica]TWR83887.1 hypothetical protein FJD37_20380 [Pseudomonas saxonica]
MSKTPDDKVADPVAPVLSKTTPVMDPVRTFRDKVYTSRTLILPSGEVLPVAKGRVHAADDQQFQYLSTHPDFERLTE